MARDLDAELLAAERAGDWSTYDRVAAELDGDPIDAAKFSPGGA